MITAVRRRITRVLIRAVVIVNPDPPMTFTTRRIDTPMTEGTAQMLADAISGGFVLRGPMGESFTKHSGTDCRY